MLEMSVHVSELLKLQSLRTASCIVLRVCFSVLFCMCFNNGTGSKQRKNTHHHHQQHLKISNFIVITLKI